MAQNGGGNFMQTRMGKVVMYGIVVVVCTFYSIDGIMEMLSPERVAYMSQVIGEPGYYAITIARVVVLIWVVIAFARMAIKAFREPDDGE